MAGKPLLISKINLQALLNIRPYYYYKVEDKRLAELSGGMESCLASLAKEQAAYILANLELSPILTIVTQVRGVIMYAMGCLCTQGAYIGTC